MRWVLIFVLGLVSPLIAAELTLEVEPRWGGKKLAVSGGEGEADVTAKGQAVRVTRLAMLVSLGWQPSGVVSGPNLLV